MIIWPGKFYGNLTWKVWWEFDLEFFHVERVEESLQFLQNSVWKGPALGKNRDVTEAQTEDPFLPCQPSLTLHTTYCSFLTIVHTHCMYCSLLTIILTCCLSLKNLSHYALCSTVAPCSTLSVAFCWMLFIVHVVDLLRLHCTHVLSLKILLPCSPFPWLLTF